MLDRFSNTTEAEIAERVAKSCLLVPAAVNSDDLIRVSKLAETSLTLAKGSPWYHWHQFTKGLSDYRQGRFTEALVGMELAQKESKQSRDAARFMCEADTCFVSAMAHYKLQQNNEAHAALTGGLEIVQTELPSMDSGDLGASWCDILTTYILMREAQEIIGGDPAGTRK